MGTTGSSSKRRSSKKKSSKTSSEVQRRKNSRKRKSKRLRRDDSVTSYSDDDSASSQYSSSSGSEDNYRSRRTRLRKRRIVNVLKRAKRRPYSSENSEDSPSPRKRKRSKRKGDFEGRKKTRKKPKRRASFSSESSGSWGCSTCQGGSARYSDTESESPRSRSVERRKVKRDSGDFRNQTKRIKSRSPSVSSFSYSDSVDDQSKEKLAGENYPGRLRSVITVDKPSEGKEYLQGKDENKEEIFCDRDDNPSCKSNNSNDGGVKRDFIQDFHAASEDRWEDRVMGEGTSVEDIKETDPIESGKVVNNNFNDINFPPNDVDENDFKENENGVSASSNGDDLESILRQKALENLKKFRGGLQTNAKIPAGRKNSSNNVMQLASVTEKPDVVQVKSPKSNSTAVNINLSVDNSKSLKLRGASHIDEKRLGPENSVSEFRTSTRGAVHLPDGAAINDNPNGTNSVVSCTPTDKLKPDESALRQDFSDISSKFRQAAASWVLPEADSLVNNSVKKNATETPQTAGLIGSCNQNVGVTNACGSDTLEPPRVKPVSEEHRSKERQDEVKDGSQFEQKTMSVMRGGEMVQVSYKVYIPKKAPALARRQLRR